MDDTEEQGTQQEGATQHGSAPSEGATIDVGDPDDLRRWAHKLHIDERTLRSAVKAAGPYVSAVVHFLATSRTRS